MKICLPLRHSKTEIFLNLGSRICIEIPQVPLPEIPDGDPWYQISTIATIYELASTLPDINPLREELRSVAARSLQLAAADLGEGVELHGVDSTSVQ
jgi:hypothetical protein